MRVYVGVFCVGVCLSLCLSLSVCVFPCVRAFFVCARLYVFVCGYICECFVVFANVWACLCVFVSV